MKPLRKLVCAGLAAAVMAMTAVTANAASVSDFKDVDPGQWYYPAVEYAVDNGLFAGTSSTAFSPGGAMTRGMFVTVLSRQAKIDQSQYQLYRFTDVKKGDYYAAPVEWAARYGIVSGTSKTAFSPNQKVTREQMAAFLYRYAKATGTAEISNGTEILRFPDTGDVSDWAKEAMTWAVDKKIINGSGGKLDPKGTATRAQVAQVFRSAKDILTSNAMVVEPQMPDETNTPSTDSKAHPNNIFNVFARDYQSSNDWQVSSKSRMDASEQAQLIFLLKGKTGNMVWNEVALNGMTTGQVGATRDAKFVSQNGITFTSKATSIEKVSENILSAMERIPDVKYFCVTLEDAESSIEGVLKDYYYDIYFINTPDAFADPADSAYTAEVKRLVAERMPSGFVWSKERTVGGGWSTTPGVYRGDADKEADSIVNTYTHIWISNGKSLEGKITYYISYEGIGESGTETLKHWHA